jgi:hypothetical protein
MGKLIEKLHEVRSASSSGFGFLHGSPSAATTTRAAALFAVGGRGDVAALDAALQNGADGIALSGWTPSAREFASVISSAQERHAIWGVEATGATDAASLKAAKEAGAAFTIMSQDAPASLLLTELAGVDQIVTITPPADDHELLTLRATNLLPIQAALLQTRFASGEIARLNVAQFTWLRLAYESLRFPTLAAVQGVPTEDDLRTLVELGADGLLLSVSGTGSAFGQQVRSLVATLRGIPARHENGSGALLTGLLGIQGHEPDAPGPSPRRNPERDPEREPEEP